MKDGTDYIKKLRARAIESRAYRKYQVIGLEIAKALNDDAHKALYIKLAKERNGDELLRLAKSIAEKQNIANMGAYFMSCIKQSKKIKNAAKHFKNRK